MLLTVNEKQIRAPIIREAMAMMRIDRAVCFTCGNAARALRDAGVDVLEVGPEGPLVPGAWWTPEAIARTWPGFFDATSGHLPVWIMARIAAALRDLHLALDPATTYKVPTGSGETIVCLRWAYPGIRLVPTTDGLPSTKIDPRAPLAWIVLWDAASA